jgi:hypothetical protein
MMNDVPFEEGELVWWVHYGQVIKCTIVSTWGNLVRVKTLDENETEYGDFYNNESWMTTGYTIDYTDIARSVEEIHPLIMKGLSSSYKLMNSWVACLDDYNEGKFD